MPPPPQLLQRQVQSTQFQFKRGAVLHFFTLSTIMDTCARLHEHRAAFFAWCAPILRIRAHLSWRTGKHLHVLHVLHVLRTYSTCSYPGYHNLCSSDKQLNYCQSDGNRYQGKCHYDRRWHGWRNKGNVNHIDRIKSSCQAVGGPKKALECQIVQLGRKRFCDIGRPKRILQY